MFSTSFNLETQTIPKPLENWKIIENGNFDAFLLSPNKSGIQYSHWKESFNERPYRKLQSKDERQKH